MSDKYIGLDYGLGRSNIDQSTGIRYGVISISSLHEFIYDDLELEYGDPSCPECGGKVIESCQGKDYLCEACAEKDGLLDENGEYHGDEGFRGPTYWSDQVFPHEAQGQFIEDKDYSAHDAFDNSCLFITRSPYYTFAVFCSPCAPGAGDLNSPAENGVKTLCFGPEMFTDNKAPYPVYRISDDTLVE